MFCPAVVVGYIILAVGGVGGGWGGQGSKLELLKDQKNLRSFFFHSKKFQLC